LIGPGRGIDQPVLTIIVLDPDAGVAIRQMSGMKKGVSTMTDPTAGFVHPERKEIARYLLSRGLDPMELTPAPARVAQMLAAAPPIEFPHGLTPQPAPVEPTPAPDDPLPRADVVVITWTVDELAGLARVLTPGVPAQQWHRYTRHFADYQNQIRSHAPAATSRRLGSYLPTRIGTTSVLCIKSELHLNQDGIQTGQGTATLPVKNFFQQIIAEARPAVFLTIGTAGSVFDDFQLGDVVITRAAKFRLQNEFRNEPFNHQTYHSDWALPTTHLPDAQHLMSRFATELTEPPFGPPHPGFAFPGPLIQAPPNSPDIKLELGAQDMPEFHPILTTDYFEYGTTTNRLDREGAAVEMGDAALGLACTEINNPPHWAVIRNMSDPVINGDLPAIQFHLNQQTTWAVGYYTAYGRWTSTIGALATWAIIAGLPNETKP
jgi:nucleoside phosphorylase